MEAADHLYCTPCQKSFTGLENISEHTNSPAHRRTVAQKQQIEDMTKSLPALQQIGQDGHESLDEFMKTEDQNIFLCELCHCTCSGKIPALNHVRGKSHRQKIQNRRFSLNLSSAAPELNPASMNPPPSAPPSSSDDPAVFQRNPVTGHFYCTVCKLSVSGEVPARQHLKGKSHARKVKILKGLNETDLSLSFSQMSLTPSVGNELTSKSNVITQNEGNRWPSESLSQDKALDNPPSQPGNLEEDETLPGVDEIDFQRSMDNNFDGDLETVGATGQWHCSICQVSLNSEKTIKQHFLGKSHQKKKKSTSMFLGDTEGPVLSSQQIYSNDVVFDGGTGQYECKICNVYLTSRIPVEEHVSGKAHQKRKSAQMEGHHGNMKYEAMENQPPVTTSAIVRMFNPSTERTTDVAETTSLSSLPNNTTNSAPLLRRQRPMDLGPPLKGQVDRVAWERSPRLDENLNPLVNTPDMNGSFHNAVIAKHMMQPEFGTQFGGYHGNTTSVHEGLSYDPAVSSSTVTSPYAPRNDRHMQQVDSPYLSLTHDSDTQDHVRTSNTVRPPPGFGPDVLPRNKPMSDFLMHQHSASKNPPSHMHRFWSMPMTETQDSSSFAQMSETPPSLRTNREVMPPIGTPAAAPLRVPEQPPQNVVKPATQGDIMNSFSVDRDPQKLLCKICNVFVTGRESAEAHIAGTKHAKKFRAFQFQKNHLEPQVTVQERPLHRGETPYQQYNGYPSNSFSSLEKTSSSSHGPSSSESFSSTSRSSSSYDYNFSSGSSSSGSFGPPFNGAHLVHHHHQAGGAAVDDRFHSLRGPSLSLDA